MFCVKIELKRSSTRCHLKMFTKMKGVGVLIQKCFNHSHVFQYTQGQSTKAGIREYFYYIDHQGMVSLPKQQIHYVSYPKLLLLMGTFTLAVFR